MGTTSSKQAAIAGRVLLPADLDVSLYELSISTNLSGNFRFDGNVKLHATVTRAGVREVVLHAKELHISGCTFTPKRAAGAEDAAAGALKSSSIEFDLQDTTVRFKFESALPKGAGVLEVDFIGMHNDQMAGFYRSGYTGRDGTAKTMVSTQFEPLEARRCFPCVDEPARKAVFRATLIIDDGLTALSNMPVVSDTLLDDGKRREVRFQDSPKMSTYLLAFCVGDFDFKEARSGNGVPIRVYTPPDKREMGSFALEVATKTLDLYDETFQEPYPLPKLDMIAIPEFAMGAMENWGLVTYREVDLLIDGDRASSQQRQRVATVVCHELAHQWFGNLVTMAWWDGIWLNEAFASWTQAFAMATLFPDWSMWEQFVFNDQAVGMRLDALQSSHPIQVPIKRAEEVEQVFDAISYYKGSSVVRLVHAYLGRDVFERGLHAYMKRHKYANTETVDLWNAWQEAADDKPVARVMASWTEQMGFPVLTVKSAEWAADKSSCTFELEQQWFISDGSKPSAADAKKLWSIPLFASVGSGVEGEEAELVSLGVMHARTKRVTVAVPGGAAASAPWVKFNGEQHVPMRVSYAPVAAQVTDGFAAAVLSQQMPATDRAGLLLDAFALAKAGLADPGDLIRLVEAYRDETSSPVFSAIEDILLSLDRVLLHEPALSKAFRAFGSRVIAAPAQRAGWDAQEGDGHLTRLLRATLIRLQSQFSAADEDILQRARERFEQFAEDPEANADALPTDIRTAVIRIVLSGAPDEAAYDRCLELIDLMDTTQAKKEIFLALGYARQPELKRRTLDWCTSGALKKQDFFYPMGSVSGSSKEGLELTWDYLRENFERIVGMISTASPSLLAAAVTNSCGGFASEARAAEIEDFFRDKPHHSVKQISRKLDQIVENTRANAKFLQRIVASDSFRAHLQ